MRKCPREISEGDDSAGDSLLDVGGSGDESRDGPVGDEPGMEEPDGDAGSEQPVVDTSLLQDTVPEEEGVQAAVVEPPKTGVQDIDVVRGDQAGGDGVWAGRLRKRQPNQDTRGRDP